jgi:hypothetical protein
MDIVSTRQLPSEKPEDDTDRYIVRKGQQTTSAAEM